MNKQRKTFIVLMASSIALFIWTWTYMDYQKGKSLQKVRIEAAVAPARAPAPAGRPDNPDIPDCTDLLIWISKMHPEHNFIERAALVENARHTGGCERKMDAP